MRVTSAVLVLLLLPGCRETFRSADEHARVRAHLEGAYAVVASRTASLPADQLSRRSELLRWLRAYIDAARYPVNDVAADRTPIFIDRFAPRWRSALPAPTTSRASAPWLATWS